jgi:chromosome segregation ATPase
MFLTTGKWLVGSVALAFALAFAGISPRDLVEYLRAFLEKGGEVVIDGIPDSIELQRMDVLLRKLNGQVDQQKRAVATAKIALEDAEAEFQTTELACNRLKGELQQLRELTKADGEECATLVSYRGISQADIRRALAGRLESWKQTSQRRDALGKALDLRRQAFAQLEAKFTEWQFQREQLAQRIETLKIRHQTASLSADADTSTFDNADLARTTELADGLERKLRIEEAKQAIGLDPLDGLLSTDVDDRTDLEAEVDSVLAQ